MHHPDPDDVADAILDREAASSFDDFWRADKDYVTRHPASGWGTSTQTASDARPEAVVRHLHDVVRQQLADLRAIRDDVNASIRQLVADEEILNRTVRWYDRHHTDQEPTS